MESTRTEIIEKENPADLEFAEIAEAIETRANYLSFQKEYITQLKNKTLLNSDLAFKSYLYDLFGIDSDDKEFNKEALELIYKVISEKEKLWNTIKTTVQTFLKVAPYLKDEQYETQFDTTVCKLSLYFLNILQLERRPAKIKNKSGRTKLAIILSAFEDYDANYLLSSSLKKYQPKAYSDLCEIIQFDGGRYIARWSDYFKKFTKEMDELIDQIEKEIIEIPQKEIKDFQETLVNFNSLKSKLKPNSEPEKFLLPEVNDFLKIYPIIKKAKSFAKTYQYRIQAVWENACAEGNQAVHNFTNVYKLILSHGIPPAFRGLAERIKDAIDVVDQKVQSMESVLALKSGPKIREFLYALASDANSIQTQLNTLKRNIEIEQAKELTKLQQIVDQQALQETENKRQEEFKLKAEEFEKEKKAEQELQKEKTKEWQEKVLAKRSEKELEKQKARKKRIPQLPKKEVILKVDPKLKETLKKMSVKQIELIKSILNKETGITYNELYFLVNNKNNPLGRIEEKKKGSSHKRLIINGRITEFDAFNIDDDGNIIPNEPVNETTSKPVTGTVPKNPTTTGGLFKQHGKQHTTRELCPANISLIKDVFEKAGIALALAEIDHEQKLENNINISINNAAKPNS